MGPWLSAEFEAFYVEWQQLKRKGDKEAATAKYAQMKTLGIAAVPCMIEKIKAGDAGLIPLVSEFSGTRVKSVKENATREEILQWWDRNKQRWLSPLARNQFERAQDNPQ